MNFLDPEILADFLKLSQPAMGVCMAAGFMLWLCGWRWHRFWIVLGTTVLGGLGGLRTGQLVGGHVLAFGILLAFGAGLMALELAKIVTYFAGAGAAWLLSSHLFPPGQERWLCALAGGLLAVLLYRVVTLALTSAAGTLLLLYAGIGLVMKPTSAAEWCADKQWGFHAVLAAGTISGMVAQALLERRDRRRMKAAEENAKVAIGEIQQEQPPAPTPPPAPPERSLLKRMTGR